MEDEKIINLYWERKDEAIMETQKAYGRQLQTIAQRIVQSYEDAEESVNDTYLKAFSEESGVQSYGEVADLLIAWYLQTAA